MKPKNTELMGGIFMVLTAVFFWSKMGKFTLYAKIFPQAIITLLIFAGIALIIKGIIRPSKANLFELEHKNKAILVGMISLAWVLLLKVIGFVVTSILALTILLWILNDIKTIKSFTTSLIIATGEVGVLYLVFSKLLYVPFPQGLLF